MQRSGRCRIGNSLGSAAGPTFATPSLFFTLFFQFSPLFRRQGWTAKNYDKWSTDLLDQQVAFVTSTSWRGETVGRLVFLHPGTTSTMVDEVLAELN